MTELRKVKLPNTILTEDVIFKSLNASDIFHEHFSITDLPTGNIGTMADFPAVTVVFDLSGSSLNIRNNGAKSFAAESQYLFKVVTNIIYRNYGIVEKFPGDGISMHFPAGSSEKEPNKDKAIYNACEAVMQIDHFLHTKLHLNRTDYRFSLTYGEDTIITTFGSSKHQELISIGHAVNVAHKLEKLIKEKKCFIGMDAQCQLVAKNVGFSSLSPFLMPEELCKNMHNPYEFWFGVKY
ncbi:hypothetical protein CN572_27555 [Bacillus wiedmannii]|uniref:hypothetical protein n=1 Tax=Bacillus cereus group TaxID=86661 RepID=UPI000BEE26BA|nr:MULTISPECIES: hypothetical protein [Bacillus cereus group]PDZ80133.1 hypothetical protein CON31_08850 [Bacillus cereus]PEO64784.1 hypothetical protein CN572_27555 [Bacillus wiedmannii]PFD91449.1 hypothetical protein CN306_10035 [Bacillus thuringiensis]PFK85152.1 hypothetical protein COJ04_25620 [Bacillus thuringiensis]PHE03845.1 hypothetical protein COF56_15235 [Bacillus wiedmannii]